MMCSGGVRAYHVRVRLQHKSGLFPPLLPVVVLKRVTVTLGKADTHSKHLSENIHLNSSVTDEHPSFKTCIRTEKAQDDRH